MFIVASESWLGLVPLQPNLCGKEVVVKDANVSVYANS